MYSFLVYVALKYDIVNKLDIHVFDTRTIKVVLKNVVWWEQGRCKGREHGARARGLTLL